MKAMVLKAANTAFVLDTVPDPVPGPGEAVARVLACGSGLTIQHVKAGRLSAKFPRIIGHEITGEIVEVGPAVTGLAVGVPVTAYYYLNCGHCRWCLSGLEPLCEAGEGNVGKDCDGGYAEYTTVDARNVHSIESPLSDAELATFATSWATAENMLERAVVAEGDVVLVTGASGGVGTALLQLIRRRQAIPVALCNKSKANQLRAIGADAILPREPHNLPAAIDQAIGRRSVDVVADVVGGPLWPQLIDVLRAGGRYTCAGAIAGPVVEFDLRTFYLNDLTFTGATVIPPGLFTRLVGYIERGEVSPILAATYPLRDLAAAQEAFLAKQHVGNIVAIVRDPSKT